MIQMIGDMGTGTRHLLSFVFVRRIRVTLPTAMRLIHRDYHTHVRKHVFTRDSRTRMFIYVFWYAHTYYNNGNDSYFILTRQKTVWVLKGRLVYCSNRLHDNYNIELLFSHALLFVAY